MENLMLIFRFDFEDSMLCFNAGSTLGRSTLGRSVDPRSVGRSVDPRSVGRSTLGRSVATLNLL